MTTELTTDQILDIDDLLKKVDARVTNDKEVRRLQYANFDLQTLTETYLAVETLLKTRAKADYSVNDQLTQLYEYAEIDGVDMGQNAPEVVVPKVNVMYVGGKL